MFQASIFVLNSMESKNFSGIHFFLVLITISMNLFDQLVIVSCDPNLKAKLPLGRICCSDY